MKLRLTPKARRDLDRIWDHSAEKWGVDQAEIYLSALGKTMEILLISPAIGSNIDIIKIGYRKFPTASHVLVYKYSTTTLDIVRVLHKNMDLVTQIG